MSTTAYRPRPRTLPHWLPFVAIVAAGGLTFPFPTSAGGEALSPQVIQEAAGTEATQKPGGVVRIAWSRDDVAVKVDERPLPPAAGLGSWAAFKPTAEGAMVMGDTVVFQDEVDAAMDAAFAHGLKVTALHNHFFYDDPPVYFMHIGGQGEPDDLARAVKAMWEAIREVRSENLEPAEGFSGPKPRAGELDSERIGEITGLDPSKKADGVVKVSQGRTGSHQGIKIGGPMGLSTWAAFSGSNEAASIDGDFIMTADEVQPVLKALREADIHVVALHNHMLEEEPGFYFTHYWGTGPMEELAHGFKAALDAAQSAGRSQ